MFVWSGWWRKVDVKRDEAQSKRTFNAGNCNPFLSYRFFSLPCIHPSLRFGSTSCFVLCGTRRLIPPSDMIFLRTVRITLYRRTTHTYAVRVSSFFFFYFFSTFTVYPSLAYVRRPRGAQIQDWRLVIHPHPINIAPLSLPLSPFFFFPSFMRYYITLRYFFLSLSNSPSSSVLQSYLY